ncbi:hypothetical protein [Segatella maculosa]|jgi:hypothetical protein|uniref:Uncharacterized protein n=1 Tax=Siphoviridae sp. ctSqC25 TaxID=2823582 RepID=A0A8S5L625_9CAUD|nr:hypothetical protein [Segatella maculosa]DAD65251.1 MAG TPA: hypothetical protein [Siphoviridae sp. ctSqC25]
MIKQQFLYFAQYPSKDGVLAMFTNGSGTPDYDALVKALKALPESSRVPEIANYVYGQSFDELKQRIDKLVGSFLFVDYGEMDMLGSQPGSFRISQRMAVTVACKMPNHADAAEYMLASDTTLRLLTKVHAWLIADADAGNIDWLSRSELDKAEIVPFVATELSSAGWTLMLSCIAPDTLDTHTLARSFARRL